MPKHLRDLLTSFSSMTIEEQFAKIREIRDTRSIERPAVAKRRKVKRDKKVRKDSDVFKALLGRMTAEEKAELLSKLNQSEEEEG